MSHSSYSFNSFQDEDPGVFYIRENGKLKSPPGYKKDKGPIFQKSVHLQSYTFTTTSDGCKLFTPKSLFHIITEFVALHLDIVDSLIGFPDIVGKRIFDAACSYDQFGQTWSLEKSLSRLTLFCNAYPEFILNSLSLNNSGLFVTRYVSHLLCFNQLVEIEMNKCAIGDDSALIPHIGNYMFGLKKLILRENKLSDVALQRLTASMRIMNKGPLLLDYLDLAGNRRISDASLRYLTCLKHLEVLILSGCRIEQSTAAETLNMTFAPEDGDLFHSPVVTSGWASTIIDAWVANNKLEPLPDSTTNFYKKSKVSPPKVNTDHTELLPRLKFVKKRHKEGLLRIDMNRTITKEPSPLLKRKNFHANNSLKENFRSCNKKRKKIKCSKRDWRELDDGGDGEGKETEVDFELSLISTYSCGKVLNQKRTLLQALDNELC